MRGWNRREGERAKRMNEISSLGESEIGAPSRKYQDPESETLSGLIGGDLSQNVQYWGKGIQMVCLKDK